VVPVFIDKHLADNWTDAKYIYDTAQALGVPLMAGSSIPTTWRRPAADVARGAPLSELVAITFHTTDAYGFHALEFAQALAEQRRIETPYLMLNYQPSWRWTEPPPPPPMRPWASQ
jgi:hypothetical protein